MPEISLREITADSVRAVCALDVTREQRTYVAANSLSIAQAYFEPCAWFRAIYSGETPIGFVMVHADPEKGEYFLWRFMVDAAHQRRGYGRRALDLVVDMCVPSQVRASSFRVTSQAPMAPRASIVAAASSRRETPRTARL